MQRPIELTDNVKNKNFLFAGLLSLHFIIFALIFFPFSYFRHDDWLILGNALFVLPKNWGSAFSPTLFYGNHEVVWFFRPFFKIFVFGFYQLFGLNYYAWLCGIWLFFAGGVFFLRQSLRILNVSDSWTLFTLVCFLPFSFGSLIWMGEGMMNCPQFFFFMFACWLFLKGYPTFVCLLSFLMAIGFKESAAIFPLFISVIFLTHENFRTLSTLQKFKRLTPLWMVALIYLAIRMLLMPLHPGYHPVFQWSVWIKPLLYLGMGPLIILVLNKFLGKNEMKLSKGALLFLICLCVPYLGHGFFSYGWLMLPGTLFIFLLGIENPNANLTRSYKIALGIIGILPLLAMLQSEGWWQWSKGQKSLVEELSRAPEDIRSLQIRECENPKYPRAKFERVVGFEAGIDFLWRITHQGKEIDSISRVSCNEKRAIAAETLSLRWQFPNLQRD
jgi:hypothetical protein